MDGDWFHTLREQQQQQLEHSVPTHTHQLHTSTGTVAKLGTAKHHESILPKLNTLELTGCFGMTELGHGSNVMGIETTVRGGGWGRSVVGRAVVVRRQSPTQHAGNTQTPQATYDNAAQRFIIHTPSNEASKYWIGGSGQHGKICAVFAQLTVDGQWQVMSGVAGVSDDVWWWLASTAR